ncbi:hypothetical protein GOODEAATRI_002849 [Goodea atripinnis]|uniref:Uncharacterized protein n=1 Tax=Goodea atripinnis TaxID=208336 RepID=A0ABV0N7N2_9TELE
MKATESDGPTVKVQSAVAELAGNDMSKWERDAGIRLVFAGVRQKRKNKSRKTPNQHFLEFKAHTWNGKSKHQTTAICHEAGQTGHTVSRYRGHTALPPDV